MSGNGLGVRCWGKVVEDLVSGQGLPRFTVQELGLKATVLKIPLSFAIYPCYYSFSLILLQPYINLYVSEPMTIN